MADREDLEVVETGDFRRKNFDLVMIQVEKCQIRHFLNDFRWNHGDLILEGVEDAEAAEVGEAGKINHENYRILQKHWRQTATD